MQLLVESNALSIFHGLAESTIEPVLTELLPYYERDEARHVGLGVLYLPRLLRELSPLESAGVIAFQMRCVGMLMTAGMELRPHLRALGMEPRRLAEHTVKLQDQILKDMVATGEKGMLRGIANPSRGIGPRVLDFIHPRGGDESMGPWQRRVIKTWTQVARVANRA